MRRQRGVEGSERVIVLPKFFLGFSDVELEGRDGGGIVLLIRGLQAGLPCGECGLVIVIIE